MYLKPVASVLGRLRRGYTLVEVLIATTLALMLMAAVARMFGQLGTSVNNSRATLEMSEKLRAAAERLRMDLGGLTVTTLPPRRVENNDGYFEYIERGNPTWSPAAVPTPWDTTSGTTDSSFVVRYLDAAGTIPAYGTVGETGDVLMFTTRNPTRPFTGLLNGNTTQSDVAEVAWFMRGRTLYRRVLLVAPNVTFASPTAMLGNNALSLGFYYQNDISAHVLNDVTQQVAANRVVVPNTLGDLSRRGCRFGHDTDDFPFISDWGVLGLPTLQECSAVLSTGTWASYYTLTCPSGDHDAAIPGTLPQTLMWMGGPVTVPNMDYWSPQPFAGVLSGGTWMNVTTGILTNYASNLRPADDVILTNVIGFDVKAWDPQAVVLQATAAGSVVLISPGDQAYLQGLSKIGGTITLNSVTYNITIASYGAYVDLGQYATVTTAQWPQSVVSLISPLQGGMIAKSQLQNVTAAGQPAPPYIYDTWTDYYENAGVPPPTPPPTPTPPWPWPPTPSQGHNGFDNSGSGMVNGPNDAITSPPYPVPLRGIQVKIRVFEPDSRNIREVTVTQDFLPK